MTYTHADFVTKHAQRLERRRPGLREIQACPDVVERFAEPVCKLDSSVRDVYVGQEVLAPVTSQSSCTSG